MLKKIIIILLMVFLTIICLFYVDYACADEYIDLDEIPVEEIIVYPGFSDPGLPYIIDEEINDIRYLKELQVECEKKKTAAHVLAESARALGYTEDHPVISLAGQEWTTWHSTWLYCEEQIKKFSLIHIEYPVAAKVWFTLKENDFTDEAAAAIIGNMMKECGGNTLALNYKAYNSSGGYYGLCQWSKKYYPEVLNSSLDFQINWLLKTVMPDFYKETDIENAAIRFAREYERCSSSSYNKRAELAKIAYKYFCK